MAMSNQQELVITRVFNAPLELVWKAWSKPQLVKKWWGPKGFSAPIVNMDFRVGGKYFNCMRSPDGKDFFSTGIYEEILPLKKIVATDSFADEKGNVVSSSHYGMDDFPLELTITVDFQAVPKGTKMTLHHAGIPEGDMKKQCEMGWNESFDKLEDALSDVDIGSS